MKILVTWHDETYRTSKFFEAFRRSLGTMLGAKLYGKGRPGYDPSLVTYNDIIRKLYGDDKPDFLFLEMREATKKFEEYGPTHEGLEDVDIPKGILMNDFHNQTENYPDEFVDFILKYNINVIFTNYRAPMLVYSKSQIIDRFVLMPHCIGPETINDWNVPKEYDIGMLGMKYPMHYPARHKIQKFLSELGEFSILSPEHPGWFNLPSYHNLVGKNYGKALSACKIAIAAPSVYDVPVAKYFEIIGSGAMLLAIPPTGLESDFGFVDGVHYVKFGKEGSLDFCKEDLVDKIRYYLKHNDERNKIIRNGYNLFLRRHTCYSRAVDFYEAVEKVLYG